MENSKKVFNMVRTLKTRPEIERNNELKFSRSKSLLQARYFVLEFLVIGT